jgi:predicted metalloprotease with PDZ domain
MKKRPVGSALLGVALMLLLGNSAVCAQSPAALVTMSVAVDASAAARGILHVHERIPVAPGAVTLVFPRWIPGEHAPDGPIVNLVNLMIHAGDARLTWLRDPNDFYAFHVEVPPGNGAIDVAFDFVGAPVGFYSSARLSTRNMLVLTWNKVLLTPAAEDYRRIIIAPSVTLPANWSYATALDGAVQTGPSVHFAPVTMEQLVDSPLDAGTNERRWPLGSIDGAPVDVAVFADTPEQLDGADATIAKLRKLVAEMGALYHARHFNHYTFLLTVSDVMAGEGVEHGQSSDDGVNPGDFLTSDTTRTANGDLLAHEFNHSWDGKYRRPADLATLNLQVPMHDDLLWVYEGMTQFYGDLEGERSGFFTAQEWRDNLALQYAILDTTTGRATRTLYDTALAEPIFIDEPATWHAARRSADYYSEGELMWLEADITIRRLSGGRRSIDDVARAFFGGTSTGPTVVTYTRDDIIAAFNAVQPLDWRGFFVTRVDDIAPHPPNPFEAAGWRVAYRPEMSGIEKIFNDVNKDVDARFSIGLTADPQGVVRDTIEGFPAAAAGLAPGDKIVSVNGRAATEVQSALDNGLRAAEQSGTLRLLILNGGVYRDVTIAYSGGPRFPVLERIPGRPDLLEAVAAPRSGT